MEHIYPIRCRIFADSPHLSGDHQRAEIIEHRAVVVESPVSEPKTFPIASETAATEVTPAHIQSSETSRRPPITVKDVLEAPPPASPQLVYTERYEYAFSDQEGHGVVFGNRGQITRCEDELIHTPGAIQTHGMLAGLDVVEGPDNRLYGCRVISENCEAICKYSARFLLQLDNFLCIFPVHQRLLFERHARSVIDTYKATLKSSEPKVFSISFVDPSGCMLPCWCAMHFLGGSRNLLICEFELEKDSSIDQPFLQDMPSTPYNSLNSDPMDAAASFISQMNRLDISGDALDAFKGEGKTTEVISMMSQVQDRLSQSSELQELLDVIVTITRQLTGFDRCMVYQFDGDYNGNVVAELVNPQVCSDVYRGLHFPASDIPEQARKLYKLNRVRFLFDRTSVTSRLIHRSIDDLGTPLDLSHSYLRAMSPIHIKYLCNMGVKSTMSIALNYMDNLWGLICCHSYGATRLQVPFPLREVCYWVGLCASSCLDKLLNAAKLRDRNSLISIQNNSSPQLCISASSNDLLNIFQSDFGFLVVKGEARTIGKLSSYPEAVTLLRYVYFRKFSSIYGTNNISQSFTDVVYEPSFTHIAGLLVIPLSNSASDFIVLFRKHQNKEVHWAGNPNMAKSAPLEPRDSFKTWVEKVKGTCKSWMDEQFEAAAMIKLVYGNFIRVWREKESTLHESRLKRLLLQNLSHEVRTPLNAVVNFLEIALEKPLDQETKDILSESHKASKSLIYIIDDLLHSTDNSYEAPLPMVNVNFSLSEDVVTTFDQFRKYASQKALSFNVELLSDPHLRLQGDLQRFQHAVIHLASNAIQYTNEGGVNVYVEARPATEGSHLVTVTVQDTGTGMSEDALNELFQEFEQVPDDDTNSDEQPVPESSSGPGTKAMMGMGLALVARYIRQCGGQIRGKSTLGQGSTFSLDVPLQSAKDENVAHRAGLTTLNDKPSGKGPMFRTSLGDAEAGSSTITPAAAPISTDLAAGEVARCRADAVVARHSTMGSTTVSPGDTVGMPSFLPQVGRSTILVADDNSVNLSILKRRLQKMGYDVITSLHGRECFEAFQKQHDSICLILMDINMPIVDGIQSTQMIRDLERTLPPAEPVPLGLDKEASNFTFGPISPPETDQSADQNRSSRGFLNLPLSPPLSDIASPQSSVVQLPFLPDVTRSAQQPRRFGRIPIFAVSASLDRHTQGSLTAVGFDGWLSKPIDFKRLHVILEGVTSPEARVRARSATEDFARGGWFN